MFHFGGWFPKAFAEISYWQILATGLFDSLVNQRFWNLLIHLMQKCHSWKGPRKYICRWWTSCCTSFVGFISDSFVSSFWSLITFLFRKQEFQFLVQWVCLFACYYSIMNSWWVIMFDLALGLLFLCESSSLELGRKPWKWVNNTLLINPLHNLAKSHFICRIICHAKEYSTNGCLYFYHSLAIPF